MKKDGKPVEEKQDFLLFKLERRSNAISLSKPSRDRKERFVFPLPYGRGSDRLSRDRKGAGRQTAPLRVGGSVSKVSDKGDTMSDDVTRRRIPDRLDACGGRFGGESSGGSNNPNGYGQ